AASESPRVLLCASAAASLESSAGSGAGARFCISLSILLSCAVTSGALFSARWGSGAPAGGMMPAAQSAAMIAAATITPARAAIASGATEPPLVQRADFGALPGSPPDGRACSVSTSVAVKSMVGGRRRGDGLSGSLMHSPGAGTGSGGSRRHGIVRGNRGRNRAAFSAPTRSTRLRTNEFDQGRFIRSRRHVNTGGAGVAQLRCDLLGQAELRRLERTRQKTRRARAVDVSGGAAGREVQHAVEALRQRFGGFLRQDCRRHGAVEHDGVHNKSLGAQSAGNVAG